MGQTFTELCQEIPWNSQGLIPAIVQDFHSKEVLMLAWMNQESLKLCLQEQRGIYWSRSRQSIWIKGDTSGNTQRLKELRIDCDKDTLLLKVEQKGPACHTGSRHCFIYSVTSGSYVLDESLKDNM